MLYALLLNSINNKIDYNFICRYNTNKINYKCFANNTII